MMTSKERTMMIIEALFIGALVVYFIYLFFFYSPKKQQEIKIKLPSYYTYYINGQSFDYVTKCWENSELFCEAEDQTIVKVDAYTPIYYDEKK